jgi:hypothetical protein
MVLSSSAESAIDLPPTLRAHLVLWVGLYLAQHLCKQRLD